MLLALAISVVACGCVPHFAIPRNVSVGAWHGPPPPAPVASPNAPPHIVLVRLSATTIAPLQRFSGTITTSTNVASVEVKTEAFAYNVPRSTFGQFAFSYVMPELPPPARRHYLLVITARNAAGVAEVERVPILLK